MSDGEPLACGGEMLAEHLKGKALFLILRDIIVFLLELKFAGFCF